MLLFWGKGKAWSRVESQSGEQLVAEAAGPLTLT